MIIIENLKIFYNKIAISYPSIHIKDNEFVGLYGKSGCGKTSLLEALFGLDFQGDLKYDKCTINNMDIKEIDSRKYDYISYCPQFSQNAFNPKLSVLEHIHLTLKGNGLKYNEREIANLMERLELDPILLKYYPYMLSGGQKQRLILLISILKRPKLLILDEPSSAIDLITLKKIVEFLTSFKGKLTIIMVAHQKVLLEKVTDRIIMLEGYDNAEG
ncbi:ATP-binding cassette domain-containing protein [Proteiniborus sp. MB09-C3]|uniref:ATP-binding cassette domain-containing protein n=1 Tax=Proteiniborus sp. MB09-C3 TaxID=3050072 RepID=UPI0025574C00|nr:ATP-binding cassette domain-containing protein [Proteiniborus sp. MB09-C3]WIV12338.1 ATP-binding cassette domain-containing protein [Proteiniborus sp. MB09-C3]